MTIARLAGAWADTAIDTVRGVLFTYASIVATVLAAALLLPALMKGDPTPMPAVDDDEPRDIHEPDCAVWLTLHGACTCGAA